MHDLIGQMLKNGLKLRRRQHRQLRRRMGGEIFGPPPRIIKSAARVHFPDQDSAGGGQDSQ